MNIIYEDGNYRITSQIDEYYSYYELLFLNHKYWKHLKYYKSIGWCKRFIEIHRKKINQPTDTKQTEQK